MAQSEVALDWGHSVFGHPGPSLQMVPVLREMETETQKQPPQLDPRPHFYFLQHLLLPGCPAVTTPNTQLVLSYQEQGAGEEASPHLSICKVPPNNQGFLSSGNEDSSPSPPPLSPWLAPVCPLPHEQRLIAKARLN